MTDQDHPDSPRSARIARRSRHGMSTSGDRWVKGDRIPRHRCEDHLPARVADDIKVEDKWVCGCGRRWRLTWKQTTNTELRFAPEFIQGVTVVGPDGALYWRAFRCRFIGWIGT